MSRDQEIMLEGVMLKRRYRLDRVIGGGAAGAVFRAMDLRLNREVAVKILRPGLGAAWLAAGPERSGIARWAELRHPNVLTLHEFGIEETLGLDYLVLDLLEGGESVLRRLERTGPLSWNQASRILLHAARGLGAGHGVGLVHRNVKLSNFFVDQDAEGRPRVRVSDFGIVTAPGGRGGASGRVAAAAAPRRLPAAAPEQHRGEPLTPAADAWGLATAAFEMLTGSLPFTQEQLAAIDGGATIRPPSLSGLNPTVPRAADDLIARALAPDPGERPASGDVFAREIRAIQRNPHPSEAPPTPAVAAAGTPAAAVAPAGHGSEPVRAAAPVPAPPPGRAVTPAAQPRPPRKRGRRMGVIVVSGSVLAFSAAVLARSGDRPSADTPARVAIAPSRVATRDEILHIRRIYQRIENGDGNLAQRRLELGRFARRAWPSADSAYATVYEDDGAIQKLRVRVYRSGGRTSLLMYYEEGRLVFIHEVAREPGARSSADQRFYFIDRALIRWRDTDNEIVSLSAAHDDQARTFLWISDAVFTRAALGAGG